MGYPGSLVHPHQLEGVCSFTVGQYRAFINAGGYRERRYWTRAGGQYCNTRTQPDHWTDAQWAGDDCLLLQQQM
jgi:formylglycine-generating enzyme required for sulfatase activity